MKRRGIAIGVAAVALAVQAGGCVAQSKYNQLKDERNALRAQLDDEETLRRQREEELATLQAQHEALVAEARAAGERLAALEAAQAKLNQALKKAEGERAGLVKDRSKLQASVEEMRGALEEARARKAAAEQRIAEYRDLVRRFQALIDAGKLKVRIIDGRMVVQLATDILFPSGSPALSPEGKAAIVEVTGILASLEGRQFQIAGHTDNVPISNARFPSNWELASARAVTVVKTMVEAGMPPLRISAASHGEFQPAGPNTSDAGKAANRRIEIVVVPDLSALPGAEELERLDTQG